ncbi:hypothetical protein [Chitinilyticum aquatile]|uniref:hypothetical protein n=1 Tax=Chitinilyticum aquatile TaxID=362520 RepID=UPI0004156234|nr:hypothetical protein [Chitinilyticum aquatile]
MTNSTTASALSASVYIQKKQRGVAALLITILIALIATTAVFYSSRGAVQVQRNTAGNYQLSIAQQAAEEGASQFLRQIQDDMESIQKSIQDDPNNPKPGKILEKESTPAGATSCIPGDGNFPYDFVKEYRAGETGSDRKTFKADKFVIPDTGYHAPIDSKDTLTALGIQQGSSWRVQGHIAGNRLYIRAEGCMGEDDCKAEKDSKDTLLPRAVVRRVTLLKGTLGVSSSALTIGQYYDNRTAIAAKEPTPGSGLPQCAVAYGDSYSQEGAGHYFCKANKNGGSGCEPQKEPGLKNKLFESFFGGMSKAELKASLPATNILAGCPTGTIDVEKDNYYWINGDISNCTISGGPAVVIINGTVSGSFTATGMIYMNNFNPQGSGTVTGKLIVEGYLDAAAPGTIINDAGGFPIANGKNDAEQSRTTHAGNSSLALFYKEYSFPSPPGGPKLDATSGNWIDF